MDVVAGWIKARFPVPVPGPESVTELLMGENAGPVVDLGQPIDVAAVARPKGRRDIQGAFAVSAAVPSLEKAKAQLAYHYRLTPGEGGMILIEKTAKEPVRSEASDDESPREHRACALVPSAGAAATRLVCAYGEQGLAKLVPYLTRTAPRLTIPSAVHLEIRMGMLHGFVQDARGFIPMLSGLYGAKVPAAADLLTALMQEGVDLVSDIDQLAFDGNVDDGGAELTFTTRFRGEQSWVVRALESRRDRVDAPPAAFMRLPKDAEAAAFFRGIDEKLLEHPKELAQTAAIQALTHEGLSAGDARALVEPVGRLFSGAPMVFGSGIDLPTVQKAAAAMAGPGCDGPTRGACEKVLKEALVGVRVMGVEEPPARYLSASKDLVAALARPSVAKWVKPRASTSFTARIVAASPAMKAAGLPKDTLHVETTILPTPATVEPPAPPAPKGRGGPPTVAKGTAKAPARDDAAKARKVHLFVVPDGGRTWFLAGSDEALLVARAKGVLEGAPETGTLAARTGIEVLRDARMNGGGFLTLEGVVSTLAMADAVETPVALRALASAPAQGMSLLPFQWTLQRPPAGEGAPPVGGDLVASARIPKAILEDAVVFALRGGLRL